MQAFLAPPPTNNVQSRYLAPPPAPTRKLSQRVAGANNDIDDFLSSDLELSFASTVSINSPERAPLGLTPDDERDEMMMDISPAFPRVMSKTMGAHTRMSGERLFGRDASNDNDENPLAPSPHVSIESGPKSTNTRDKRLQRSALPTEWFSQVASPQPSRTKQEINMFDSPAAPSSYDAMDVEMDVDMSFVHVPSAEDDAYISSPEPSPGLEPTTKGFSFNNLFFESTSPVRNSPAYKKRRSTSPDGLKSHRRAGSVSVLESSPAAEPSSPIEMKVERNVAAGQTLLQRLAKPMLSGLGGPSAAGTKRTRRPALSTTMANYEMPQEEESPGPRPSKVAPPRRAFSAMLPANLSIEAMEDGDSSFESGPDMSSPAQAYTKRQQTKTLRRRDGTEDFRASGAPAIFVQKAASPRAALVPEWGGFGDNEAHGKILPCHRVREDGLMRINTTTLNNLLDGMYDRHIAGYTVIDCRFDYEYDGGHVPGAININTTSALEEFLLGPGVHKPLPSTSGEGQRKPVLIFHCEFSVKRAPTFAKHLRSKDRALNNHNYPKVHYPEIYVLEGGYCQYFKDSARRCQPPNYIRMDDPHHAASRKEDLDNFRKAKFGRTKSYAYGEAMGLGGGNSHSTSSQQPVKDRKRSSAPTGPTQLFTSANVARARRSLVGTGSGLSTLNEHDHSTSMSSGGHGISGADASSFAMTEDEESDIGDSPCPPPTKAMGVGMKGSKMPALGVTAARARVPLKKAETYGGRFGPSF